MDKELLLVYLKSRLEIANNSRSFLEENFINGQISMLSEIIETIKNGNVSNI